MTAAVESHTVNLFHADETCDSCGAQPRVLVLLNSGGELVFCDHHVRRHRAALEPIAFIVRHSDRT